MMLTVVAQEQNLQPARIITKTVGWSAARGKDAGDEQAGEHYNSHTLRSIYSTTKFQCQARKRLLNFSQKLLYLDINAPSGVAIRII